MEMRYWIIGTNFGPSAKFYADSMGHAFHLARLRWGSATLHCYGSSLL